MVVNQGLIILPLVDHLPEREKSKRKVKKIFELDFNEDFNFEPHFRSTRVSTDHGPVVHPTPSPFGPVDRQRGPARSKRPSPS